MKYVICQAYDNIGAVMFKCTIHPIGDAEVYWCAGAQIAVSVADDLIGAQIGSTRRT